MKRANDGLAFGAVKRPSFGFLRVLRTPANSSKDHGRTSRWRCGCCASSAKGCPTLARLARLQRGVAAAINADGRWRETLTVPASSMLSCYGAGGRYRKHTDNSRGADGVCGNARALTCICYLNPDWAAEDGGALRIYDESGGTVVEVAPAAGRVVVFDSFLEHEVLEARRDRYALTFWIFAER